MAMKRFRHTIILLICLLVTTSASAGDYRLREEVRFITDKMAYELKLDTRQYNDVFEINYDFINGANYLRQHLLYGDNSSLNSYYSLLDYRNEDLRWVLTASQYREFSRREYFHRPYYTSSSGLTLRVFVNYSNRNHYYYAPPRNYRSYRGGNRRDRRANINYYNGRYNHKKSGRYNSIRSTNKRFEDARRRDFGTVNSNHSDRKTVNSSTRPRRQVNTNSSSTRRRGERDVQTGRQNNVRNNSSKQSRDSHKVDRNNSVQERNSTNSRQRSSTRSNQSSRSNESRRQSVQQPKSQTTERSKSSESNRSLRTNAKRVSFSTPL